MPNMLRWLIGIGLMVAALAANAQTYAYRTDTFGWLAPSGSATTVTWTNTCTSYPNGDDVYSLVSFPGGFTFDFAGTSYSQVRVMSNGMIQFGADAGFHRDYTSQALPITNAPGASSSGCANSVPQNLLLVYWLDINTAPNISGALVQYEMLGTAPNRRFVITWNNVALYGNPATRYSFQVVLNEDNTFKYQYTTGSSTGSGATVGVQLTTTDYTQYAYNQSFIDTTNGTAILWYRANQAQPKLVEYFFNEASWASAPAADVKDSSGNGRDGTRIGSAQSSNVQYQACRSARIPSNTTNVAQDAVSIPWTPGSVGSLSFWYRPSSAADAMLFDASSVANRPFFLMKTAAGQLRLVVTDTAGSSVAALTTTAGVAANAWRHIAVSWYMQTGTNQTVLRIYVNGVLQNVWRGTTNGIPGSVTNAYLGDNRTSGVTPNTGTPNSANGYIDNFKIYPYDMSNVQAIADMAVVAGCSALHHFDVSVSPVAALTCEWVSVTIAARDSLGGAVQTSVTANLGSSTGHGDWRAGSATGVFTPGSSGSGGATYTFNNESVTTLLFNTRWEESVSLTATAASVTGTSSVTAFSHAGFKFVTGSMVAATVSKKIACLASNASSAGTPGQAAQTLYLQAWKSDQTTFACNAANQDFRSGQTVNVGFSLQCVNPTNCVAGQTAAVNGTNIALAPATPATPGTANYTNVALTFDGEAKAPVVFSYTDVGRVQIWASYNLAGAGAAPPNHMNGVSNAFTVAPASFRINSVSTSGGTANPISWPSTATPTIATTGFTYAGDQLLLTMDAMNACAAPARTPNFGNESVSPADTRHGGGSFAFSIGAGDAVPPTSVAAPVTVTAPVFTNGSTSTAATIRWDEVGAFKATVSLSDYFGAGTVNGTSDWIGRFYPHHFDTVVTQTCVAGDFAYSGQAFPLQISARNVSGNVTQNYAGAFARTVSLVARDTADTIDNPGPGALAPASVAAADFVGGVTKSSLTPTYTFANRQTTPVSVRIRATETEVKSLRTPAALTVEGVVNIRSGRARLSNAYGSEMLDLPVGFRTEFWNGTGAGAGWVLNTADSCTGDASLGAGNAVSLALVSAPGGLPTCVMESASPGLSGAGCATATVAKRFREGATPSVGFAGDFNLWLRAPGASNPGSTTITATVPAWLGAVPAARAVFGIYKTPLIYRREVFR